MPELIIEPLKAEQIRLLYPILREQESGVGLDEWIRFAQRVLANAKRHNEGIIVASWAPRRFPCGMVCYRRDNDLQFGHVLTAEHFIAMDLLDPARVLTAMMRTLDTIAAELNCGAVRSVIHRENGDMVTHLSDAGHQREGTTMCKPLVVPRESGPPSGD